MLPVRRFSETAEISGLGFNRGHVWGICSEFVGSLQGLGDLLRLHGPGFGARLSARGVKRLSRFRASGLGFFS